MDVTVHVKKNFVFGIALIKKLKINDKNIATVVNENTVHHKLIEASRSMIGKIKMGKTVSNAICLAPPIHGIRSLSCIVFKNPVLFFSETDLPLIKLKIY